MSPWEYIGANVFSVVFSHLSSENDRCRIAAVCGEWRRHALDQKYSLDLSKLTSDSGVVYATNRKIHFSSYIPYIVDVGDNTFAKMVDRLYYKPATVCRLLAWNRPDRVIEVMKYSLLEMPDHRSARSWLVKYYGSNYCDKISSTNLLMMYAILSSPDGFRYVNSMYDWTDEAITSIIVGAVAAANDDPEIILRKLLKVNAAYDRDLDRRFAYRVTKHNIFDLLDKLDDNHRRRMLARTDVPADRVLKSAPIHRITPKDMEDKTEVMSADAAAPKDVTPQEMSRHTIRSACQAVASHYNKSFDKLHIVWPLQVVDGSEVVITDSDKQPIASARLRVGNKVYVHEQGDEISVGAYLTDLVYSRSAHTIVSQK